MNIIVKIPLILCYTHPFRECSLFEKREYFSSHIDYKLILISWSRSHSHYSPLLLHTYDKYIKEYSYINPFIINAYLCDFSKEKYFKNKKKKCN